jgi:hypothetical protein
MSQDLGDDVVGNAEEATAEDLQLLAAGGAEVPVVGGADDVDEPGDGDPEDDGDERVGKVDKELADAGSEADREAIRARRREERKRRRAHERERFSNLERTIESLSEQNRRAQEALARLQSNDAAVKLSQLDNAIEESRTAYGQLQQAHADAITRQDGPGAVHALERMNQVRDRFTQLTAVKENVVQAARTPSPIDPGVRSAALDFAKKHKWYGGPDSKDLDSTMMTTLDRAVTAEGFDPRSPTYWAELEARAKKYIPHRFNGASQDGNSVDNAGEGSTRRPRSPVGGGSSQRGNDGSSNGEGEFRLSAERVSAMKEAGIWDDKVRRDKMIATYKKQDRENSNQR